MSHISRHKVSITGVNEKLLAPTMDLLCKHGQQLLDATVSHGYSQHKIIIDGRTVTISVSNGKMEVSLDSWGMRTTSADIVKAVEKAYKAVVAQRQARAMGYNAVVSGVNAKREIEIFAEG